MNLGYIRYGFSLAFRCSILLQWFSVASYRCLKSQTTVLATQSKTNSVLGNRIMACNVGLANRQKHSVFWKGNTYNISRVPKINCSSVILKIHKWDSLNISRDYKLTKNVVRFFVIWCLFL